MQKYYKIIGIGGLFVLLAIAIFFGIYRMLPQGEVFVQVSGVIVTPEMEPVADVDLVSGDTRIRTTDSGQFSFGSVSSESGITLTHPNLLRAFTLLPQSRNEAETMTVYFEDSLLNTLVTIVDREARGKLHIVYEYLPQEVQTRLSLEAFTASYTSLYTEENITDQMIVIAAIEREEAFQREIADELFQFTEVYTFALRKENKEKSYRLTKQSVQTETGTEEQWFLIP